MRPSPLNERSENNGLGMLLVLFIVFLIQKLTGAIDWSWWWVTAPLWIPVALAFVVGVMRSVFQVESR